jgi:proline-rich protein PRCC
VLLRPQIDLQKLAQASDSDDDEAAPAAKRARQAPAVGATSSALSFLPAPKNSGTGKRMDMGRDGGGAGGSGSGGAAAAGGRKQQQEQPPAVAAAAAAAAPSNEAYRVRPGAAAAAAAAGGDAAAAYYQQQQYDYAAYHQQYADQQQQAYYQQQQQQLAPEEAFLQEALAAETAKATRRGGGGGLPAGLPDVQFKEVKADDVKYVDPAQREAQQGMRAALGSDYAAQLRASAAPHVGSGLARKKHQIGTLFANAKLRELEVMENRAQGMKSKASTAGKYGWA